MKTPTPIALTLFVCASLLSSLPSRAEFTQQGPKLVDPATIASEQGWSVSISADGNTAILGGPATDSHNGAAWIWIRSGGVWTQQGPKLTGDGETEQGTFGTSVTPGMCPPRF